MSLAVRVGDRIITRLAEDVTFSRGLHGDAACGFRYRDGITRDLFDKFAKVYLFDFTGDTQYEGRMEDPGRSVDGDGQLWAATAVGESARASDRAAGLIYIDTGMDGYQDAKSVSNRVKAATAEASDEVLPTSDRPGLLLQFGPGNVIDTGSTSTMRYDRFRNTDDMSLGGFGFSIICGTASSNYSMRVSTHGGGGGFTIAYDESATTTESPRRHKSVGATFPLGDQRVDMELVRVAGGATTIGGDNTWGAFIEPRVSGLRVFRDGTNNSGVDAYAADYVLPHEVVEDLLGRLLAGVYDAEGAAVSTEATYQIKQMAYPDGVTPAKVLEDLMALEPDFYWQVGHTTPDGKPSFVWRKWPTHVRYEFSMRDGLDLPGNDAERYNRVTVRWKGSNGHIITQAYEAGTTIGGIVVPTVPELDAAGLVREPEVQDLADEIGSQAEADRFAAEFLLEHGTPPAAGTLTVARKVWDNDLGRLVEPYEIQPGHLLRVRELATEAGDLSTTARDGRSVFRVMGMEYRQDSRAATVELDAPPKSDETDLAQQLSKRLRKR